MLPHLILTGFSGSGKSTVGRLCARLLGWPFLDTDEEVARRAGRPVPEIFRQEGEEAFRALERRVVQEACARSEPTVIAVGGGAIAFPENREAMFRSGVVVCLEARPETLYERLRGTVETRPLLRGADPLARIRDLKGQRQPFYALADWTVHTDHLTPEECAREAVRGWDLARRRFPTRAEEADLAGVVHTAAGPCPVYLGWGLLDQLGERCRRAGLDTTAYLITDRAVLLHHGRRAQRSLEEAGIPTHLFVMAPGETSKTLDTARQVYEWLAELRAERGHFVVAVGGGVVGDLAGFVAATYNRGMPFVQVPTTLAAMVDASIGGKTAVNLPAGKNLVGAFHQPRFVLADVSVLQTLPERELRSGWAEAIKHGLIRDRALFEDVEALADALLALDPEALVPLLRRSVRVKIEVVSQDEKETRGLRLLLNYGHTLGHAIEAVTGYRQYLHGEAVAIGMAGEARLSRRLGLLSSEAVERQDALLRRFGLPTRCPGLDPLSLRRAMEVDKKKAGQALRWVLLEDIGRAVVRSGVPEEEVEAVLWELTQG